MQKLIKALFHGPRVEFEAARIRVTPLTHEVTTQLEMTGRHYQIEMKDEAGLWHKIKRVKRFEFVCDADKPATFSLEYYDCE